MDKAETMISALAARSDEQERRIAALEKGAKEREAMAGAFGEALAKTLSAALAVAIHKRA